MTLEPGPLCCKTVSNGRPRSSFLGTAAGLLLACNALAAASLAGQRVPAGASASDQRLLQKVDIRQIGGTVADYLKRVSTDSNVDHTVERLYSERPLLALNARMTLERLQRGLAAEAQLSWIASGDPRTYLLKEEKGDREARSVARTSTEARTHQQLAARWESQRRIALLSDDQLRKLIQTGAQGDSIVAT